MDISMTSVRVLQNLNRLIWGNAKERRYMRHRIALALRGIDISGAELEDLGLNEARSFAHTCSSDPDLREVFDTFRISPADAALDAGCGKGAALLTMATYPFGRVDGVEISPVLVQIARRNLQRAGIQKATVFCSDASEFRELDPYT